MDEATLKQNIAANISECRRRAGLTQAGLSEKINYSDKSVSKWERGEGVPDAQTLVALAELFGVTVNDLVYAAGDAAAPERREPDVPPERELTQRHLLITFFAVALVWFAAGMTVCLLKLLLPSVPTIWCWRTLLYALPASFAVWFVFSMLWWPIDWQPLCLSGFVWTAAAAIYFTFPLPGIWLVAPVAATVQVLILLAHWLRLVHRGRPLNSKMIDRFIGKQPPR